VNVEQLRKEAAESNAEHTASVAKLRADTEAKTRTTDATLSDQSRTLRVSQTGGIGKARAALLIIIVGTVLAGIAPDIVAAASVGCQ
jgi:hypothetical protein